MIEKNKKSYTRKCIVTGEIFDINELIRFYYDKEKKIVLLDIDKNKKGRGCYLKNNEDLWNLLLRKKAFNRSFRTTITTENYNQLYKELQEKIWQKK